MRGAARGSGSFPTPPVPLGECKMMPEHVVIVGAGHAGGCAASALRTAGFSGRVTLVGSEKHPPYERPPLSKELLAGSIPAEKTYLRPFDWYAASDIGLRLETQVRRIDRRAQRLELSTGETLPYDALLLTTGARAKHLDVEGSVDERIHYIRDIDDALALRARIKPGARVAIVGAGFIGLEIAATARQVGCTVTVLEVADHPLLRVVPPEGGAYCADLHRTHGVNLELGCRVVGIDQTEQCCMIHTSNGSVVHTDLVAVGIGAVPNAELATESGLSVDNGIVVDEFGRSSDPAIFAAGDVTMHFNPLLGRSIRLEAWQNAQNQAIAVAKVMAGGREAFAEIPWLWTDQFSMNMQVAGAPATWDKVVRRGEPGSDSFILFQLMHDVPVGAVAINCGREMRFVRRLLARGQPVSASMLADRATKLQDMCG